MIFYKNLTNRKNVKRIEMCQAHTHQSPRLFAKFQILYSISPHQHPNTIHRAPKLDRARYAAQATLLLGASLKVPIATHAEQNDCFVGALYPLPVLLKRLFYLAHLRVFLHNLFRLFYHPWLLFCHPRMISNKYAFVKPLVPPPIDIKVKHDRVLP